jgi:hypothetical protein
VSFLLTPLESMLVRVYGTWRTVGMLTGRAGVFNRMVAGMRFGMTRRS